MCEQPGLHSDQLPPAQHLAKLPSGVQYNLHADQLAACRLLKRGRSTQQHTVHVSINQRHKWKVQQRTVSRDPGQYHAVLRTHLACEHRCTTGWCPRREVAPHATRHSVKRHSGKRHSVTASQRHSVTASQRYRRTSRNQSIPNCGTSSSPKPTITTAFTPYASLFRNSCRLSPSASLCSTV